MKANKSRFIPVLAKYGFSLKTKAFNSIISNEESRFNEFKSAIMELGVLENESEVYAMMLLNRHLNGSTVNWGNGCYFGRARMLLNKSRPLEIRKEMFNSWWETIMPKTFNKWESALLEVKQIQSAINTPKEMTIAEIEALLGFKVKVK